MVAVTYGIRPAGGHDTGWGSAKVLVLVGLTLMSPSCRRSRAAA
jgi:hypothetical protein